MKILFIAPIPPPTNGQSLAAKLIYTKLKEIYEVFLVNMSKSKRENNIFDRIYRGFSVVLYFKQIYKNNKKKDLIYFTISESFAGNFKDIIVYLICFRNLNKMVVHMLGGAGIKKILENNNLISKVNIFFLKKLKGVIVEGNIQAKTFANIVEYDKIHIITNFAENYLFSSHSEVTIKFTNLNKINILYLSNLIDGKGYNELADAYIALDGKLKKNINLNFVGGFKNIKSQETFLLKIKNHDGISYLGNFIDGIEKKMLYLKSQIFCLPTYYPFEGQPISILEAYATGCFVITTGHSGIPEIFRDKINGIMVEPKSVQSIKQAIEYIYINKNNMKDVALYNLNNSINAYNCDLFTNSIMKVLI